jgi:hypothetical protein
LVCRAGGQTVSAGPMAAVPSTIAAEHPSNAESGLEWLAGWLLALAACIAASRPFWPRQWASHPWMTWLRDDFFYYLAIARNLAQGHGSTFNGLVPTNGYHPLWLLLLAGVCRLSTAPRFIIGFVAVSCVLATVATYACAVAILRRCGVTGGLRPLLAAYLALNSLDLFFYGMEATLAVPLALLLMALMLRAHAERGAGWWFGAGLLVSALVLARLDGIIFAALTGAGVLFLARPALPLRRFAGRSAAAFAAGLLPMLAYFLINRVLFGLWMPVSGMAKLLRRGHTPSIEVWSSVLIVPRFGRLNLAVVLAGVLLLPVVWRKMRAIERAVLGAALLFPFVFVLILSMRSDWGMWPWYGWVWRPALCASLALWFGAARPVEWVRSRAMLALIAAAVLVRLATTAWPPGQLDFYQAAVEVRDFAATHPGVYAMGDRAGMLGYLLPQPLVQTEGLVMDREFLRRVERQDDLWRTLALYKVRYYIGNSWDDEPAYRNGCFHAVEPVAAGAESPHMRGVLCDAPLLRVKHDDVETMVFRLK